MSRYRTYWNGSNDKDFNIIALCKTYVEKCYEVVADNLFVEEFLALARCIFSNPILKVVCLAASIITLMPILVFLIFTIVNTSFAFMGFALLQVSVLGVGLGILGCIFFCILLSLGICGLWISCFYYSMQCANNFYRRIIYERA